MLLCARESEASIGNVKIPNFVPPRTRHAHVMECSSTSSTSSSLTVFLNGAEAIFQDCTLINSFGAQANFGSVANANSSSIVNSYRCEVAFQKSHNEDHGVGVGVGAGVPGWPPNLLRPGQYDPIKHLDAGTGFWNIRIWMQVCFGCRYEGFRLQFLSFHTTVDKSNTDLFVVSE
jgi:hypothetical protein